MEASRVFTLLGAVLILGLSAVLITRSVMGQEVQFAAPAEDGNSFYGLQTRTLAGEDVSLGEWAGQVALVVNVASRCGFTPQYGKLEELHERLADRGFTVLGFPSNDFGKQEPGTAEEIREFCSTTYGITFPMFEKRPVTGDGRDAVYRFLTEALPEPNWNFTKYLVGRDGRVIARFSPKVSPDDERILKAVEKALAEPADSEG